MPTEKLSLKGNFNTKNNSMDTAFKQPHEITEETSIHSLIPEINEIPKEFDNYDNKWRKAVLSWFFSGINKDRFKEKLGIDKNKAISHLSFVISDWGLKHEHKLAGAAFLMSLWFDDVILI
jgi:hypothetical protein